MPYTLEEEQAQAEARPITGRYPEFARELRRLMGHGDSGRPFLTARMAEARCRVNRSSIAEALRGGRMREDTIYRLARGLDGDLALLLRLARYAPPPRTAPRAAPDDAGDEGEADLLALYRDLAPPARRLLLALAQSVRDHAGGDAP